jgi:hypothetical protein
MNDHDGTPLIEAYRARVIPSRRTEDEILERLQPAHRTRAAVWTIGAAVALAAALLALWFGTLGDPVTTRASASPDEAVHGVTTSPDRAAVTVDSRPSLPEPAELPELAPPAHPVPTPTVTTPTSPRMPRPQPPSGAPSVQDIAAEAALVAEAQAALRDGDAGRARLALEAHARRFPNGVMRPDARALAVIVACTEGRAAAVATEVRAVLDDPASAAFAARIRHACGL